MSKGTITLLHLYPAEMNIYGDWGNVLTIMRRLEWHGYSVKLIEHHPGQAFAKGAHIVLGGGGQDSGQLLVEADLQKQSAALHKLANDGAPMLMVCGLYQLFGNFFQTSERRLQGIGIFNLETHASDTRLIGNTIVETPCGEVIGYENHSGQTTLGENQQAFGQVIQGAGNNGRDKTEGAIYKNVIGTYLHGSLLPKNPELADWLVQKAVEQAGLEFEPEIIDDTFAQQARAAAKARPR